MAAVSGGNMNSLPASTIRLLGSTQVITSVFSVIKELIENSLDAGAKTIEVKLDNYGLDKIELRDNGSGIHASDIPVIAKRHYTSKITSHADLETLASYGFRGEALASLCAVSEVCVTTKTEAEDVSQTYTLNSEGDITNTVPSHLGQGTTVCAKNLFKNLPVRKQYHNSVKKKKEDLKNVENLLLAYSVILPTVRFSLRHNKEVVWQKPVLDNTAAVLQSILGKAVMGRMEWNRRNLEEPQIQLELCAPKAGSDVSSLSRSTADRSFLCINKRPVVVKEIDRLVRQYYNNCHGCETNRHPVYYLGITLPSKDVDVNLDPNKTSVMATSMPSVLEQLEEILLYIYGPLDQAPSWKYRDRSEEIEKGDTKHKATNSANGTATSFLQRLRRTSTDREHIHQDPVQKDDAAKGKPSSSSPASIAPESALGKRHSSTGSESDSLKNMPEVQVTVNGNRTGVAGVHVEGSYEKENSTEQQDQLLKHDSQSSSVLKEGSCSRVDAGVPQPQGLESNLEPTAASGNFTNNTEGGNAEKVTVNTENSHEGSKNVEAETKKAGEEEDLGSSKKSSEESGPSGWSHGISIRSGDGTVVQPVRLLAPSSVQLPGKRPLLASPDQGTPPEKRGRKLSPAKSTLYDMINNTAVKRPLSARDFFFKDKRPSVVEENPEADYDEVTDILATMWDELSEESRVAFREKCWHDTQRYNKEVAAAKNVSTKSKEVVTIKNTKTKINPTVTSKARTQMSVRDMVAACSTQPSPSRTPKKKVVPSAPVTDVGFNLTQLKSSLQSGNSVRHVDFPEAQVLGCLPSCGAWVCGRGKELCLLNAHRLSEAVVFQRLMNQHRLPVHHCQPVALTPSNTGGFWSTLEMLAGPPSVDTFSLLSDCRITHNGFDVQCWRDGDGHLCGEVVGLCGDVPTHGIRDLVEVLGLIRKDSAASLAQCRPLKVVNYLKGEAVRMVRQQVGDRSVEDVQDMLEQSMGFLPTSCQSCLHDRPFFHTLVTDVDSAMPPEDCTEEEEAVIDGAGNFRKDENDGDGFDQVMSLDDLMDFDD